MRWFGPPAGVPGEMLMRSIAAPVGASCERCTWPIVAGQRGFVMYDTVAQGMRRFTYHRECLLEALLGVLVGSIAGYPDSVQ